MGYQLHGLHRSSGHYEYCDGRALRLALHADFARHRALPEADRLHWPGDIQSSHWWWCGLVLFAYTEVHAVRRDRPRGRGTGFKQRRLQREEESADQQRRAEPKKTADPKKGPQGKKGGGAALSG